MADEAIRGLVERLRAGLEGVTPGPWTHCSGGCQCTAVLSKDYPVCEVTKGEWGDEFPSLRFKEGGPGLVGETSVEAYIDRVAYGEVSVETAMRNRSHIANCSPDNIAALLDALSSLQSKVEELEQEPRWEKLAEEGWEKAAKNFDRALAAEAKVERMAEALKPFATAALVVGHEVSDETLLFAHFPSLFGGETEIRVGDLRAAARALAEVKPDDGLRAKAQAVVFHYFNCDDGDGKGCGKLRPSMAILAQAIGYSDPAVNDEIAEALAEAKHD